MYQSIESRVQAVQANIDLACSGINQSAESVKVIAVSKLQSTEIIQEAYDQWCQRFWRKLCTRTASKSRLMPHRYSFGISLDPFKQIN